MIDAHLNELIRTSLNGMRELTEEDACIGRPLVTLGGFTVIPVRTVRLTVATGGVDLDRKRPSSVPGFGGGGGGAITVTPTALLTISPTGEVRLLPVNKSVAESITDRAIGLVERAPELLRRMKDSLFPDKM
jgi:uncharacterized spore protein YtfJ